MHERADCTTPLVAVPAQRMSDDPRIFRAVTTETQTAGLKRPFASVGEAAEDLLHD